MKERHLLRREFIKLTSGGIAAMTIAPGCIRGTGGTGNMETDKKNDEIIFRSPWLKVAFPQNRPGISFTAYLL